ncbi:MAG: response regulator [Bradymonadaceae bacterium]|nr:response regulator [Lujinxingiaceae bacterium]
MATASDGPLPGLDQIGQGLNLILEGLSLEADDVTRARLRVLLQGIDAVADYLSNSTTTEVVGPDPHAGLGQFINAFRKEAQKRLGGLSISMMGIFNERASAQALEQSAGHLHAIRGGAAMLNLTTVAELAAAMEQVIVTMRRLEAAERVWPTKTLLRGYAQLRSAAEDKFARLDERAAHEIIADLRHCLGALAPSRTESPSPGAKALPAASDASAAVAIQPAVPIEQLEQRILIVDDIATIAASVGFVLSELDVPLDIANDGQDALRMLRERPYSLVISDVAMPHMSGVELTRHVRGDHTLASIPLILLTSLDRPEERQAGMDAGATDYIIKGAIGGGELLHLVEELLKSAPFVARIPTDEQRRILVAEDTETVAASIAFVLSEGPYDIVLAHDGKDALARLQKGRFDLLITDVQMPQMSGVELVAAIRAQDNLRPLPIIMLTSLASDADRSLGLEAGADRYLVKGEVAGGKLLTLVQELLAAHS